MPFFRTVLSYRSTNLDLLQSPSPRCPYPSDLNTSVVIAIIGVSRRSKAEADTWATPEAATMTSAVTKPATATAMATVTSSKSGAPTEDRHRCYEC
jgi:hypothetical protein